MPDLVKIVDCELSLFKMVDLLRSLYKRHLDIANIDIII